MSGPTRRERPRQAALVQDASCGTSLAERTAAPSAIAAHRARIERILEHVTAARPSIGDDELDDLRDRHGTRAVIGAVVHLSPDLEAVARDIVERVGPVDALRLARELIAIGGRP